MTEKFGDFLENLFKSERSENGIFYVALKGISFGGIFDLMFQKG